MKIIKWLLTLKEGKQLLACLFIAILFLSAGWVNEKRNFAEYRTQHETKDTEMQIAHGAEMIKAYTWIVQVTMSNNSELVNIIKKNDSLTQSVKLKENAK